MTELSKVVVKEVESKTKKKPDNRMTEILNKKKGFNSFSRNQNMANKKPQKKFNRGG